MSETDRNFVLLLLYLQVSVVLTLSEIVPGSSNTLYSVVFKHRVAVMYLLRILYFHLKCCNLSCLTCLSLQISPIYGHHHVHVFLAQFVPLYVNITHRV
jgi:hypothetical protein